MNTTLPQVLETKLADFRRRVWVVKLAEGLLAALFGIALSYLLVFALDRFFETPGWLRLALLVAGAATLGLGLPLKWHRWVWRQRRLEDAARLLRRTFPRLGDQLLGIVELARMDHGAAGRSERLVEAAMAQAADAVRDKDFTHAVPDARHHQWAWAAGGVLALAALAFAVVDEAALNALARWITPWRDVERFTFAKVEPLPSRLVVPYAEPFNLPVRLSEDTRRSPDETTGRIGTQPPVFARLETGKYPLVFPPQKEDAVLAVSLGDVRKSILLQPRPRPELAALAVRLRLPAYLGYQSEQRIDVHGGAVSLLKGAEASFEAKASRELATAQLDGREQKVEGETIVTDYLAVSADADRKFTWKDQDGLTPRDPLLLKVRAVEDDAPKIVARRESQEQVVLDSEVVTFDLNARDDFGIKRVGLEWTGSLMQKDGKTPITGEKVASGGEPEKKELEARATFCAKREGVAPQTLEVRAWTEDYLPGRPHARSASFVLHVLDKTDHALWITEQFGKWLEAAKESYEREQQLHQANKDLRALNAADLERPENRRRVSNQAAAENANAARVEHLTQSGRNLVEQATKNDEFDAKRLESWATMLKSLKEIASTRMPSVSDLLKQTANAPSGKPGAATQGSAQPPPPGNQVAKASENKSAPSVSQGAPLPSAPSPAAPTDPNAAPKPAAPSIADREAGFMKTPEAAPADPNAAPKPPGGGKLKLPVTTLAAAPSKKGEDASKPPETPAQEKLETAIVEQKDLLAEFAKVSDQLGEILASLETSTFVKRFKAASRQQMSIASNINQKTLDAFGIEREPLKEAAPIAQNAKDQSEVVRVIQSDLDAYFQRKQDSRLKTILEQMKKTEIVRALARGGEKMSINLSGQSLMGSEFWADTMDRWSEELVAASNCKSCSSCSGDSLPPEIVLKVMQALRDEMKLRDETRETENSRSALAQEKFTADAKLLGEKQAAIGTHTDSAISDILALPEGASKFGKELKLLETVVTVMEETTKILLTPETGAHAIAAETEAIELLLQAKRMSPNSGGGGGSNPGGGGRAATASSAALSDLGPGGNAESVVSSRLVGQATGRAGKEFPEEFKPGLDAYFNLLEGQSAGK
ncbi:MAG: hypothetical protein JWL90_3983 [Chthoniobacteraceae bacterium]|nr:hypothetical protein [Chthoniobacteraceae bacterium]